MISKPLRCLTASLFFMLMLSPFSAHAQKSPVQLANTEKFTLHSEAVNDDFEIYVGLPFGYERSETSYKVLYVLDANVTFGMVNDIQTLISFEPENPAMIIVGIGYKDFGNWIQKRARDYMPSAVKTAPGSGGAAQFLSFLEDQLIPHINEQYRTNDSRIIYGHSTAGLFGLYTLFQKPDLFEGYIITSPSVDEDNGYSMGLLESSAPLSAQGARVFTSHGTREKKSFTTAYKAFMKAFKGKRPSGVQLRLAEFDASHMASMAPAFVKGLEFVNGSR